MIQQQITTNMLHSKLFRRLYDVRHPEQQTTATNNKTTPSSDL